VLSLPIPNKGLPLRYHRANPSRITQILG
jgi:hypothetical protein